MELRKLLIIFLGRVVQALDHKPSLACWRVYFDIIYEKIYLIDWLIDSNTLFESVTSLWKKYCKFDILPVVHDQIWFVRTFPSQTVERCHCKWSNLALQCLQHWKGSKWILFDIEFSHQLTSCYWHTCFRLCM